MKLPAGPQYLVATEIIAAPLLEAMEADSTEIHSVLITLSDWANPEAAAERVREMSGVGDIGIDRGARLIARRYLSAYLTADQIWEIVKRDRAGPSVVDSIWPNFPTRPQ